MSEEKEKIIKVNRVVPKPKPRGMYIDIMPVRRHGPVSAPHHGSSTVSPRIVSTNTRVMTTVARETVVSEPRVRVISRRPEISTERPVAASQSEVFQELAEIGERGTEEELVAEEEFVENTTAFSEVETREEPDGNQYSIGGRVPFVEGASVLKRPLSGERATLNVPVGRAHIVEKPEPVAPRIVRKNVYPEREESLVNESPRMREPSDVVVIPTPRKKKGWVVPVVILVAILFGGGIGVGLYFLMVG